MRIHQTFDIAASAERVWDILGPNYTRAGDWASGVYLSAPRAGTPQVAGAPAVGRTCQTSLGPFTESIIAYDDDRRHVAYVATGDKMPGFVRRLANSWTVETAGPNAARVTMELEADIAQPFRTLMGWMMKRQFSKVLAESTDDLKIYAETGRPSARKRKADASKQAKAARATPIGAPAG